MASTTEINKAASEDIQEQLAILRKDIASLASTVSSYGRAQGSHLKAVAEDRAAALADTSAAQAREIKRQAGVLYSDAERTVAANPAVSVSIAAGIGFLLGAITARR